MVVGFFIFANLTPPLARYDDPVTLKKAKNNPLLLDHILFTQSLVNGSLPLQVNAHAGLVELRSTNV